MGVNDSTAPEAQGLLQLQRRSTAVFVIATVINVAADGAIDLPYAVVSSIAFAVGFLSFCIGFWNGLQRSKEDEVTLWGLLAASSAHVPAAARNTHWVAIGVQLTVAVIGASLRPFTAQAFGLLMPMMALGLAALWGSRYASFHRRDHPRA